MRYLKRSFERTLEEWPYLFMIISVAGLLYIGLNAVR
jgi:hypothetical protein